jgi:hypothetical protein
MIKKLIKIFVGIVFVSASLQSGFNWASILGACTGLLVGLSGVAGLADRLVTTVNLLKTRPIHSGRQT